MITETKETQIIKNYKDPMLNYKIKLKNRRKNEECMSIITHINVCIDYIYSYNSMYTQLKLLI